MVPYEVLLGLVGVVIVSVLSTFAVLRMSRGGGGPASFVTIADYLDLQKKVVALEQGRSDDARRIATLEAGRNDDARRIMVLEAGREQDKARIAQLEQQQGRDQQTIADLRAALRGHGYSAIDAESQDETTAFSRWLDRHFARGDLVVLLSDASVGVTYDDIPNGKDGSKDEVIRNIVTACSRRGTLPVLMQQARRMRPLAPQW